MRAAYSALARIRQQRDRFATAYAAATSPQQRFNIAATALRSSIATGKQRHPHEATRRLDALTTQLVQLLDELHTNQQHAAEATLRAEERRITRNERKRYEHGDEHAAA